MNAETRRARIAQIAGRGIAIPQAVHGALEADVPPAPVREWGWWAAVWDRPRTLSGAENALQDAQEAWDRSERFVQGMDEVRAERETRETVAQQERDAKAAKRDAEKQEQLTKTFRAGYFSVPGTTEEGFQKALPELLERHRMEAALSGAGEIESPISARNILTALHFTRKGDRP
jgi:hypothetical protein